MAIPEGVELYFTGLPAESATVLRPVFEAVAEAMPEGYELGIHFGMPGWVIPLATYPTTYNGKPLAYVSLAAGKSYNSLYLMGLYSDPERDAAFRRDWAATGLKLDMGKSCLRFRSLDQLELGLVSREVAAVPVERFLEVYERIGPGSRLNGGTSRRP